LDRHLPDLRERRDRIRSTAEALGIDAFLDVRPSRLSGGERQRVALARALVRRPPLLLLDEPFSDLDVPLRVGIGRLLKDLHRRFDMTTLLITHDRQDAYLLAERVGLMRKGRIVRAGPPDTLYRRPGDTFTARFLTDAALLRGEVRESGFVDTVVGRLPLAAEGAPAAGGRAVVALRPEEITLGEGSVRGTVRDCEFAGGRWRCRLRVGEVELVALHDAHLEPGTEIGLRPAAEPRTALKETA
ncbi:MAG: ATP-binding cassette domain-containing protein, partial [Planctomycetota bacterium]